MYKGIYEITIIWICLVSSVLLVEVMEVKKGGIESGLSFGLAWIVLYTA